MPTTTKNVLAVAQRTTSSPLEFSTTCDFPLAERCNRVCNSGGRSENERHERSEVYHISQIKAEVSKGDGIVGRDQSAFILVVSSVRS